LRGILPIEDGGLQLIVEEDSFGLQTGDRVSQGLVEGRELQSQLFQLLVAEIERDFRRFTLVFAPATAHVHNRVE